MFSVLLQFASFGRSTKHYSLPSHITKHQRYMRCPKSTHSRQLPPMKNEAMHEPLKIHRRSRELRIGQLSDNILQPLMWLSQTCLIVTWCWCSWSSCKPALWRDDAVVPNRLHHHMMGLSPTGFTFTSNHAIPLARDKASFFCTFRTHKK